MHNVLHSAMSRTHTERSDMDHTVYLQITPCLPFVFASVHQMAPRLTEVQGIWLGATACYSFIDPEGMKGWVGLVGWPIADGLTT